MKNRVNPGILRALDEIRHTILAFLNKEKSSTPINQANINDLDAESYVMLKRVAGDENVTYESVTLLSLYNDPSQINKDNIESITAFLQSINPETNKSNSKAMTRLVKHTIQDLNEIKKAIGTNLFYNSNPMVLFQTERQKNQAITRELIFFERKPPGK